MRSIRELKPHFVEVLDNGCWQWLGYCNPKGYGTVKYQGKMCKAHRVSYLLHHGSIDEELQINHKCDYTSCVNPDHLELVTNAENMTFYSETLTHCAQGHPFSGDNLARRPNGGKACRICQREANRQCYYRRKYGTS